MICVMCISLLVSAKKGINIELIGGRHGVAVELYDVEEGVKLYNKTTLFYTISKKFSFPETDGVRLYFDKRDETNFTNNEEVIVKNSELYYFTYLDEPGWNCHLDPFDGGNPRCISLHGGQLFWKGTYIVRKRYPSFQKGNCRLPLTLPYVRQQLFCFFSAITMHLASTYWI